jgi:uncharacterized membrane protein
VTLKLGRPNRRRPNPRPHGRVERTIESAAAGRLERLIFLSDGVFAIAMTLLVVELTVPELGASAHDELFVRLLALGPKFLSYVISFLVIASYWSAHQRIFSYVVRADDRLVWLSVLLLLCIAFQPFPTSVLGTYGNELDAVTLYAGTLATTGVVLLALWIYVTAGHRLVIPDLDRRLIEHHTWRAVITPLVFLVSIGIARFNPTAAELSWLAIAVLMIVLRWIYRNAS